MSEPLETYDGSDGNDLVAITMDDTAVRTLASTMKLTPTEKRRVRKVIAGYLKRCEDSRAVIHYSQVRPYTCLGDVPEHGFTADCSSYVTAALFWAQKQTGTQVEDPNGRGYDGYGFTGTLLAVNHTHHVPPENKCLVGDLAIYGPLWATKHVVICRTAGSRWDSVWSSHGSESGPKPVHVYYRSDLLGVYRPKALL